MQHTAKVWANHLIEQGIIANENREVYVYGLELIFSAGSFMFTALLLGWVAGYLPEALAYLLAFMPIRCLIGGYHFHTPGMCLAVSLVAALLSIFAGRMTSSATLPVLLIVSLYLIFRLSPIIHPNHPLSIKRKNKLKKWGQVMGVAEAALICILHNYIPELAMVMAAAFLLASLCMAMAVMCKHQNV